MKIKIFCAETSDAIEVSINQWLEANPSIEVAKVAQTQVYSAQKDGALLTISIFYRETSSQGERTGFTA